MARRIISLLLLFVLLLLPACQQRIETDPSASPTGTGPIQEPPSCTQLLSALWGGEITLAEGSQIYDDSDRETLSAYIQGAYGLADGEWEDAAVGRETGMSARETAVLRFADESAAQHGEALLRDYLRSREGDFTGYAPAMAKLAADGVVCRQGLFVGLFIYEDSESFQSALRGFLEAGELPSTAPAPSVHDASPKDLVDEIWYTLYEAGCAERPSNLRDANDYLTDTRGVAKKDFKQAFVLPGTAEFELTVLRCTDENAAARVEEVLRASTRILWDDTVTSSVCRRGEYVGEFICQNSGLAEETFLDLLENGFEPRGVASVTSKPVAAVHDLLYRLLVEGGACPDWSKIENKGWQDVSSAGPTAAAWMFGPTPELYEDCAFAWWGPESAGSWFVTDSPCALVLFQTGGEKEAKALLPVLRKKVEDRKELAQDGLDVLAFNEVENKDEIDKLNRLLEGLENAQVMQSGRYAALLMCDDPAQTAIALPRFAASPDTVDFLRRYVQGSGTAQGTPDPNYPNRELFTPPNEEDMSIYDTSAILAAWEKGSPAGLSAYDREIYDAAKEILDGVITEGMTDLEKEAAVYTWLTSNVDYDWSHMDVMAETARDAYGPYGGLVNRSAVCLGYATSFQILMDMLGIECVTVVGAGAHSTMDHAWNVVKPDGKWYCVDATWDANGREQLGGEYEWRYFNLTSDEMAKDHQWDYANVPEAVTRGNRT